MPSDQPSVCNDITYEWAGVLGLLSWKGVWWRYEKPRDACWVVNGCACVYDECITNELGAGSIVGRTRVVAVCVCVWWRYEKPRDACWVVNGCACVYDECITNELGAGSIVGRTRVVAVCVCVYGAPCVCGENTVTGWDYGESMESEVGVWLGELQRRLVRWRIN